MIGRQPSVTSLSKYATGKSPNADLFNGSKSRDFCNSFWGAGDAGVNVLLARMRGASRTVDELRNFWKQRSIIEEEYASRLASLAKSTVGKDEIGELRNSIDTLLQETENQAGFHLQLAHEIRNEIEAPTAAFSSKQSLHKTTFQAPIEKRFKQKNAQEAYVLKAREKYEGDLLRINSYTTQLNQQRSDPNGAGSKDADRIQQKLTRAQQTVQANEKDYLNFAKTLSDLIPRWEQEWKEFCDKCQDLEDERLVFMRDNIWAYANAVSTLCIVDDQSCEKIRVALDQLEPDKDMEFFVQEYGTGSTLPERPKVGNSAANGTSSSSSSSRSRFAQFERASERSSAPAYQPSDLANASTPAREIPSQKPVPQSQPPPPPVQRPDSPPAALPAAPVAPAVRPGDPIDRSIRRNASPGESFEPEAPSTRSVRSQPSVDASPRPPAALPPTNPNGGTGRGALPVNTRIDQTVPGGLMPPGSEPSPQYERPRQPSPSRSAVPSPAESGPILFYVKALYDYTATIDEEFDFQAGDVIAVTATPDDGWWIGELLDEQRRIPGRNVFPSNFVCLF